MGVCVDAKDDLMVVGLMLEDELLEVDEKLLARMLVDAVLSEVSVLLL